MREESYLIRDINEPIETVAIVFETAARAAKSPIYAFLEHHEKPNIMRGRRQPLELPGMPEYKRPDTGKSWYHPVTRCFMNGRSADFRDTQAAWAEMMMTRLSEKGYDRGQLKFDNGDVFFSNGSVKHIMGTSIYITPDKTVRVLRACWYEQNPLPEISDLLRADRIDPLEFEKCNGLVKGDLFSYLVERFRPVEIAAKKFISEKSMLDALELQKQKEGDVRGACVTDWKR